jgi:hypothetical protein
MNLERRIRKSVDAGKDVVQVTDLIAMATALLRECSRSHVRNQEKSKVRSIGIELWPAGETGEALPDCATSPGPMPSFCHLWF